MKNRVHRNGPRYLLLVLGALAVLQVGCGPNDQPELGQVSGTVTLNGVPLTGVAVVFQPENGRPARGTTDSEGKYELIYIRQTKGSKVGPNRVEIAANEEGEEAADVEFADGETQTPSKNTNSGKPVIPARYNVRSELQVDVKPGKNTFDFNLEA